MKKQFAIIALLAAATFSACGGGTTQNQGQQGATDMATVADTVSTATTESVSVPQKVDDKIEITISIIKQLWQGVPDSVLTADKIKMSNDTITSFDYSKYAENEPDEEVELKLEFELNLECYFCSKKSGGYQVLVYSSSSENNEGNTLRWRFVHTFTCTNSEITEDELFKDNSGYIQFDVLGNGKFEVSDYHPGKTEIYKWDGENIVLDSGDDSSVGETTECNGYEEVFSEKLKKFIAELPSNYTDSIYFYTFDSSDCDYHVATTLHFLPYKKGGYIVIGKKCSEVSGYYSEYDEFYMYKDGKKMQPDFKLPEPNISEFFTEQQRKKDPKLFQEMMEYPTGYIAYDFYGNMLRAYHRFDDMEAYDLFGSLGDCASFSYKWDGEKFVKSKDEND